jgi:NitT/TauT family transport system substrate-binding protein
MKAQLKSGLLALAVLLAGVGALYGVHRARAPHRKPLLPGHGRAAKIVRVGVFPNVTHAVPLLGLESGAFARALGPDIRIQAVEFNAGPSAVEALFAGSIDMTYVGPNPAINAHQRARGAVRVVAGAASGGASLVVREDAGVAGPADLKGRKLATPQLGNTQDVAARAWLKEKGVEGVQILPIRNPDQLTAFLQKDIDAAWAVEPWASRLVREAGGRVLLDERELWPGGRFPSTVLLVDRRFLEANPGLVRAWLRAHVEVVDHVRAAPAEARREINAVLARLTGKPLRPEVLEDAWGRFECTWDPLPAALERAARQAFEAGFLGKEAPDLRELFELGPLNDVLHAGGRAPLPTGTR